MNKKKTKLLIALVVVIGGIGALIAGSMQGAVTSYMKPSEMLAKVSDNPKSVHGVRVRVGGTVITKTTKGSAATRQWEFTITDDKGTGQMEIVSLKEVAPDNRITVKYKGILPDTFQDGVIAIVDGSLDKNNVFTADKVMAKCPSKYEASDKKKKEMAQKGRADKKSGRGGDKSIEQ